jgi:hypothetical protein
MYGGVKKDVAGRGEQATAKEEADPLRDGNKKSNDKGKGKR